MSANSILILCRLLTLVTIALGLQARLEAFLQHVELNEEGYQEVAALESNEAMKLFAERLLEEEGKTFTEEGFLSGFVPWFSGDKATQTLANMRQELFRKDWVIPKPALSPSLSIDKTPIDTKAAYATSVQGNMSLVTTKASGSTASPEKESASPDSNATYNRASPSAEFSAKRSLRSASEKPASESQTEDPKKGSPSGFLDPKTGEDVLGTSQPLNNTAAMSMYHDEIKGMLPDVVNRKQIATHTDDDYDEIEDLHTQVAKQIASTSFDVGDDEEAQRKEMEEITRTFVKSSAGTETAHKDSVSGVSENDTNRVPAFVARPPVALRQASTNGVSSGDNFIQKDGMGMFSKNASLSKAVDHKKNMAVQCTPEQVNVRFTPGMLGIGANQKTGVISKVINPSQAWRRGVRPGWHIEAVDNVPYSASLLDEVRTKGNPFHMVFSIPCGESKSSHKIAPHAKSEESTIEEYMERAMQKSEQKRDVSTSAPAHKNQDMMARSDASRSAPKGVAKEGVLDARSHTTQAPVPIEKSSLVKNAFRSDARSAASSLHGAVEKKSRTEDAAGKTAPSKAAVQNDSRVQNIAPVRVLQSMASRHGSTERSHRQETSSEDLTAKTNRSCESLQRSISFKPGKLGIGANWRTGVIRKIVKKSQAAENGVASTWAFNMIDGNQYSERRLDKAIASGRPYNITFSIPCDAGNLFSTSETSVSPRQQEDEAKTITRVEEDNAANEESKYQLAKIKRLQESRHNSTLKKLIEVDSDGVAKRTAEPVDEQRRVQRKSSANQIGDAPKTAEPVYQVHKSGQQRSSVNQSADASKTAEPVDEAQSFGQQSVSGNQGDNVSKTVPDDVEAHQREKAAAHRNHESPSVKHQKNTRKTLDEAEAAMAAVRKKRKVAEAAMAVFQTSGDREHSPWLTKVEQFFHATDRSERTKVNHTVQNKSQMDRNETDADEDDFPLRAFVEELQRLRSPLATGTNASNQTASSTAAPAFPVGARTQDLEVKPHVESEPFVHHENVTQDVIGEPKTQEHQSPRSPLATQMHASNQSASSGAAPAPSVALRTQDLEAKPKVESESFDVEQQAQEHQSPRSPLATQTHASNQSASSGAAPAPSVALRTQDLEAKPKVESEPLVVEQKAQDSEPSVKQSALATNTYLSKRIDAQALENVFHVRWKAKEPQTNPIVRDEQRILQEDLPKPTVVESITQESPVAKEEQQMPQEDLPKPAVVDINTQESPVAKEEQQMPQEDPPKPTLVESITQESPVAKEEQQMPQEDLPKPAVVDNNTQESPIAKEEQQILQEERPSVTEEDQLDLERLESIYHVHFPRRASGRANLLRKNVDLNQVAQDSAKHPAAMVQDGEEESGDEFHEHKFNNRKSKRNGVTASDGNEIFPSTDSVLNKQSLVVDKLKKQLLKLKGSLQEKEASTRAEVLAARGEYEQMLTQQRLNTTRIRRENNLLKKEVKELDQVNDMLRTQAESLHHNSIVLKKELQELQLDLATAEEFLVMSLVMPSGHKQKTTVLRELEEVDESAQRQREHEDRLREVASSKYALLQMDEEISELERDRGGESIDFGNDWHGSEGDVQEIIEELGKKDVSLLDSTDISLLKTVDNSVVDTSTTVQYMSSLGEKFGDWDREHQTSLIALRQSYEAELQKETNSQAILLKEQTGLEEKKVAAIELRKRLRGARKHMMNTKALLAEEIKQLKAYAQRVGSQ